MGEDIAAITKIIIINYNITLHKEIKKLEYIKVIWSVVNIWMPIPNLILYHKLVFNINFFIFVSVFGD